MEKRMEDLSEDKTPRVGAARRLDHGVYGQGRVWIFLVLGVLALVFSAALTGVYMNVRTLTSSLDSVEVMPSFVPAVAGGMTGLLTLVLFWKRYKVLVYSVLVLCTITVVLSVMAAVLTGTHILQPLLSVSGCVFSHRARMCRCATQFRRDGLELEAVSDGEQVYLVLLGVSGCGDMEDVLPVLLFAMIGIYGVLSIVCVAAGVISLLVYQTELRMRYLENVEDDTCSAPPSPCSSGNYAEHHSMLPANPTAHSATALINIYTNPSPLPAEEDNINDDGNTTPSDLTYGPADVPMGYTEACNMRRCQSFSQPGSRGLQEGSPGSSLSSHTVSLTGTDKSTVGTERNTGKLQDHRKKGRRAVTLHGLDREQLLLILSLQMRYLQESDQSAKREVANTNCELADNKTAIGPEGRFSSRPPSRADGGLSSGPESRIDGGLSSGADGGCELENRQNSGPGHCNADLSWLHSDQRRAVTPTPMQERLSSSRITDDDLDYRPAKLTRSHTPQPHHFKNPGQYSQNWISPKAFQSYQPHPYHQHKQTPQHQQSLAVRHDEEETPTLITYDLRNITKTGPIVYENIPASCSSLSHSHLSNNSPLLAGSSNIKLIPPLPQTGHLQSSPTHQPDPASQILILGGNIHVAGKPWNQFSRQTSQASTSSQVSLESSPSDTRRLVPAKEKMTEPSQTKTKGKKKLTKKEKNLKKDNEKSEVVSNQSGLIRTDSNASKGGVVADRWQTLMENGPKQVQTLWENVQRKVVSDPQTPDSTLDLRPFPDLQSQVTSPACRSFIPPPVMPKHGSFQTVSTPKQSTSSLHAVPNGILKNSNVIANYLPGTSASTQNVSQNLPASVNPSQVMHYPNVHQFPSQKLSDHCTDAFIPLATSSVGNYEDLDEVFPAGQQPSLVPCSTQYSAELHAPQKQARVYERQISKFGTVPSSVQPVLCDNPGQSLRPKSYMSAVDRQVADRNSLVTAGHIRLRPATQGMDMEYHMRTHLLMEGPVMDNLCSQVTDRPMDGSGRFVKESEHMHLQPHREWSTSSEVTHESSRRNSGHILQNASQHPDEQGHFNNLQHHHLQEDETLHPQWSAFQSSCNSHQYPASDYEICDTDLDDLPRPLHHRQPPRGQMYSSPMHLASPIGHPFESGTRMTSTRSPSSSSCEPQNTSSTSSERSPSPSTDLQRGFPERYGAHSQGQLRALHAAHVTDRRFCVTQQYQQLKSHQL